MFITAYNTLQFNVLEHIQTKFEQTLENSAAHPVRRAVCSLLNKIIKNDSPMDTCCRSCGLCCICGYTQQKSPVQSKSDYRIC